MSVRNVFLFVGVAGLLVVAVPGAFLAQALWGRLRSEPIDASHVQQRLGIQVPFRLVMLVKRDVLAYQAHASLGSFIDATGGDPRASGVQWFKAAAHARSGEELDQVIAGLLVAKRRSSDVDGLQSTICRYVENGYWTGRQRDALAGADLRCPERTRR